ncbi:hypothetical protein C5B86_10185 [Haloferax sp. Atlit-19N]|uniref:hypothetical protein n=1 Tax=Haloferax TaxID=2251 RepID=UPI000679126D|nr:MULTISPECIES: hypothetical protein [Haloferax]RDZ43415.1 hypothetical protein C5B86_10185 [Haloferax sp. Atlit-19N]
MSSVNRSNFVVDEVTPHNIWLKMEGQSAISVAVERTDSAYSNQLAESIEDLEEGDRIEAQLESKDKLNTVWRFDDISEERQLTP